MKLRLKQRVGRVVVSAIVVGFFIWLAVCVFNPLGTLEVKKERKRIADAGEGLFMLEYDGRAAYHVGLTEQEWAEFEQAAKDLEALLEDNKDLTELSGRASGRLAEQVVAELERLAELPVFPQRICGTNDFVDLDFDYPLDGISLDHMNDILLASLELPQEYFSLAERRRLVMAAGKLLGNMQQPILAEQVGWGNLLMLLMIEGLGQEWGLRNLSVDDREVVKDIGLLQAPLDWKGIMLYRRAMFFSLILHPPRSGQRTYIDPIATPPLGIALFVEDHTGSYGWSDKMEAWLKFKMPYATVMNIELEYHRLVRDVGAWEITRAAEFRRKLDQFSRVDPSATLEKSIASGYFPLTDSVLMDFCWLMEQQERLREVLEEL